jgi:hypothetical protein
MGITPKDIAAQRAIIERGEEKRKRLRDKFAAAALTGILSNIPRYQLGVIAVQAYDIADEMLRERLRNGAVKSRETVQQLKDAEDFVRIREQFEAWQKEQSVGVAEMDSVAGRKPVATPRSCARSCSQPFDSAPTTHDAVPEAIAASSPLGNPVTAGLGTGNTTTLTDEEREAIETADAYMSAAGCYNTNVQKTLRGLLERLGGER